MKKDQNTWSAKDVFHTLTSRNRTVKTNYQNELGADSPQDLAEMLLYLSEKNDEMGKLIFNFS